MKNLELIEGLNVRDPIYRGQVKKVSRRYREKLKVNKEEIINTFLKENVLFLGRYRHGTLTNYDYLVEKINVKYQGVNLGFSNEIIHSLGNRVNDLILECLIEAVEVRCKRNKENYLIERRG